MQYPGTMMITTNISKENRYDISPEFRIVNCTFSLKKLSKVTLEGPRGSTLGQHDRSLKRILLH